MKVCGADGCHDVTDRATMAITDGGPPTAWPDEATPFYRVKISVKVPEGESVPGWSFLWVPAAEMIAVRGRDVDEPAEHDGRRAEAAHARHRAAAGLQARAARADRRPRRRRPRRAGDPARRRRRPADRRLGAARRGGLGLIAAARARRGVRARPARRVRSGRLVASAAGEAWNRGCDDRGHRRRPGRPCPLGRRPGLRDARRTPSDRRLPHRLRDLRRAPPTPRTRPRTRSSRRARAMGRFRAGAPFRPWLLTIVANEARNRRRAAGRRSALALRAAAEPVAPVPLPEAAALAGAERRELAAALARLGPEHREVIALRYLLDLSEAECAAALGCRPGHRQVAAVAGARAPAAGAGGVAMPELETQLRALADDVVWPATPDLAAAVAAAPRARARARRAGRQPPRPPRCSPRCRRAAARAGRGRRLPRRARRRARVARPARRRDPPRARPARGRPPRAGGRPRPPRHARAGAARGRLRRRRSRPSSARPTASASTGQRISLVYAPRPGLPELDGIDAGLILTESRGGIRALPQKLLLGGHGGRAGVGPRRASASFISGGEHGYLYETPARRDREDRALLAGPTLIWVAGGRVHRLETAAPRATALRIARSVAP